MNKSIKIFVSLASVGLAANVVRSETDYSSWYQYTGADKQNCYTAQCWVDPADESKTPTTAQAGRQYYVPVAKLAGAPSATATFPGGSLAVAGTLQYSSANKTYTVNDLILCPGGLLKANTSHSVAGKLTVEGTADNPSVWYTFLQAGRTWGYRPALVGDSTAFLSVGSASVYPRENLFGDTHRVTMDMSGYEGEIVFRGLRFVFEPSKTDIPGKITVKGGAILDVPKSSGAYTVGALKFENGAELRLKPAKNDCGYFSVSKEFSLGETFKLSGLGLCTNGYYRIVQLTGEAAAAAPDVSAVQLDFLDKVGELPRNPHLVLFDNADGSKDVRVVWDEVAYMKKANDYSIEDPSSKAFLTDAVADFWVNGVIPGQDFDGDIYAAETITFWQYTTKDQREKTTLTIAGGKNIYQDSDYLYLKEVHFAGSGNLYAVNAHNVPHVLFAPVVLHGGTVQFGGWGNRWLEVRGDISGAGALNVYHNNIGNGIGVRVFGQDDSFGGSYTMSGDLSTCEAEVRPAFYLEFGGGVGFGGDFTGAAADAWKSVCFKTYPWVVLSSDVSVTNPTRGVLVQGGATIEVQSGKTLTITEGMTYGGKLVKRGAGALVLGNATTKFLSDTVQVEDPIDGTNVLSIVEGTLEVAHANAVNGLAVSFAEDASLVVDPNATGDLLANGAVNVKWATPFATTATSGKIAVTFKTTSAPARGASVAICTVTDAAAASLRFDVPEKLGSRTVMTRWRSNGDGTQTFVADISEQKGLFMIFW